MRYLITGAGSGIGRAAARRAARGDGSGESVAIALVDRDQDAIDEVSNELTATGVDCITIRADLADAEAPAKAVFTAVEEFGGLDSLISNAGITAVNALEELDLDTYERTFAINTRATWLLAKAAHPALRDSHGSIVATASISADHPTPPLGAYSASKAALVMIVQQMALEWGKDGIRANCVSPGPTDTALTKSTFGAYTSESARQNRAFRESLIPLRRIGVPENIAEAIFFLSSKAASQITGVNLAVDGGLSRSVMPISGGAPGFRPADWESLRGER